MFVTFLLGNTNGTTDDCLDVVSPGLQPAEFLSFPLLLCFNGHTCPTLKMFLTQFRLLHSGKGTAWWFGLVAQQANNFYASHVITLLSSCLNCSVTTRKLLQLGAFIASWHTLVHLPRVHLLLQPGHTNVPHFGGPV